MQTQDLIASYIAAQPDQKRDDMQTLHEAILQLLPGCKLRYSDGKNDEGKVVTNPSIGYGSYIINYANGSTREFFQVGLLANSTGISVHILGIEDKAYLPQTYGETIGKASVTGYCIKFKKLSDIDLEALKSAILYGVQASNPTS